MLQSLVIACLPVARNASLQKVESDLVGLGIGRAD
jgi:hypothetical protein